MAAPAIRPAAPGDDVAIAALLADARLPLAGLETAEARFVADLDGAVVGVAALEVHTDDAGRASLLRSVAVRPDLRDTGLGAALTTAALQVAGEGPVALLTETAPGYFPRFGFVEVPREALPTALAGSEELRGACAVSARAFLRPARIG